MYILSLNYGVLYCCINIMVEYIGYSAVRYSMRQCGIPQFTKGTRHRASFLGFLCYVDYRRWSKISAGGTQKSKEFSQRTMISKSSIPIDVSLLNWGKKSVSVSWLYLVWSATMRECCIDNNKTPTPIFIIHLPVSVNPLLWSAKEIV